MTRQLRARCYQGSYKETDVESSEPPDADPDDETSLVSQRDPAWRPPLRSETPPPHAERPDIQRRILSHKSPPELRGLVLRTGVLSGSTWWYAHHKRKASELNISPGYSSQEDKSSGQHAYKGVQDMTEKAIFDTVIFKIDARFTKIADGVLKFDIPPSLESFKSRIRLLDVAVHIDARRIEGYQPDLLKAAKCIDTT